MTRLFPLPLYLESGPVIRVAPALLLPHFDLGGAQSSRRREAIGFHRRIEGAHQRGGSRVGDFPQAGHHPAGAGIHEPPRQPNQTFAADLLTQTGLTSAQHDQVGRQVQVVDVLQFEKTVLWAAFLVDMEKTSPESSG